MRPPVQPAIRAASCARGFSFRLYTLAPFILRTGRLQSIISIPARNNRQIGHANAQKLLAQRLSPVRAQCGCCCPTFSMQPDIWPHTNLAERLSSFGTDHLLNKAFLIISVCADVQRTERRQELVRVPWQNTPDHQKPAGDLTVTTPTPLFSDIDELLLCVCYHNPIRVELPL